MLLQAVVIFLPILNFFKFDVKGERSIVLHKSEQMIQNSSVIFAIKHKTDTNSEHFAHPNDRVSI